MYYRQNQNTVIKTFEGKNGSVGYIKNHRLGKDRAVDSSGAIFLKALSRQPRTLENLVSVVAQNFTDVEPCVIEEDAREFFNVLETDGFIVSGESLADLDRKDISFSYSSLQQPTAEHANADIEQEYHEESAWPVIEEHLGGLPLLHELHINTSNRCNERCIHCYIPLDQRTTTPMSDIDPSLFYDVLSQCQDSGVVSIVISGGEPMLHPSFPDFLRKAKESDFVVNIYSNLTALNEEILHELQSPQVSIVQTSLYSMNPETHDAITGVPGSFQLTMAGIHRLIEKNVPLGISCIVMKQNKESFLSVLHWGRSHHIPVSADYGIFAPLDHSNSNLKNRLSPDELETVMYDLASFESDLDQDTYNPDFHGGERRDEHLCGICKNSISMNAQGDIYPCSAWQNYVLGNVKNQPLREIWNQSPQVRYLRDLRWGAFDSCLSCIDIGFCSMCLMKNANENKKGDPFIISDFTCKVAALKHQISKEKAKAKERKDVVSSET